MQIRLNLFKAILIVVVVVLVAGISSSYAEERVATFSFRKRCKNVEIRNLNVYRGGDSVILAEGCDGLLIDNVDIRTDSNGLNFSECHGVTVADCRIDAVRREYGKPAGGGNGSFSDPRF